VANSGFNEDWNNDGLTNGQEFFFAINPNATSAERDHLPSVQLTPTGPRLSYTKSSDLHDAMLFWQESAELSSWIPMNGMEYTRTDNGDGTNE